MKEYTAEDIKQLEVTYEELLFELEDEYPDDHLQIKQQIVKVMLKDIDPAYRGFVEMYIEELLAEIKESQLRNVHYMNALNRLESVISK